MLPLYVFCGEHLLLCRLRPSDSAPGSDAVSEIAPVIAKIRSAWPETQIVLRGDAENRIYEQLQLPADRASASRFMANQIRLYFSGLAYVLCSALRRLGIDDPAAAEGAAAGQDREPDRPTPSPRPLARTIRRRYLKVAVRVRQSTRRIRLEFASAYPYQDEFAQIPTRLMRRTPIKARAPGVFSAGPPPAPERSA